MIKTLLIVVLLVALLTGAGLSRPTQGDFERIATPPKPAEPRNVFERIFKHDRSPDPLANCDYRNRLLWTDVYLDGQHVATGAFGRWWWTEDGKLKLGPKT